jgi:hypothetical protein
VGEAGFSRFSCADPRPLPPGRPHAPGAQRENRAPGLVGRPSRLAGDRSNPTLARSPEGRVPSTSRLPEGLRPSPLDDGDSASGASEGDPSPRRWIALIVCSPEGISLALCPGCVLGVLGRLLDDSLQVVGKGAQALNADRGLRLG